ncbi:Dimethylaniline monooxygenase [N-oxide-forming] 2 [Zalerion maritima]|uniref:Dimethylaniline monooxygenase [N-oxide-forming] 2 n=1 Tax=Zalerion maritima TaxID=339359 RepID=A0AAD5WR63_9PEZI|nr:Dimethylaniline monooxygenase [N-oxide-forming] 2 [Zalerion maritima]
MDRPCLRVGVIGGGASGLTTLKHLLEAKDRFGVDIEARLFEAADTIGGVFENRVWEGAELVSSKYLTGFSDFRLPADLHDFITPQDYVQFLHRYCDEFDLWPYIHISTPVRMVKRFKNTTSDFHAGACAASSASDASSVFSSPRFLGEEEDSGVEGLVEHHIQYQLPDGSIEFWTCDALAVCSGLNYTPNLPSIPGLDRVPIVMHSSQFRNRHQFGDNQSVVILGVGETGQDISYIAVHAPTKEVILCHSRGFMITPKIIPEPVIAGSWGIRSEDETPTNKPLDCAVASLFDTMYLPQCLQKSCLPWNVHDGWVRWMFWTISGTTCGLDQWVGGVHDEQNHVDALFMVKTTTAVPYYSAPYRSNSLVHKIRRFFINVQEPDTKGRIIDLSPWPTHIDGDGVMHFMKTSRPESERMKNRVVKPDVVVLATGYRVEFPFLEKASDYPVPTGCDVRGIWRSDDITAAFIGFVRPTIGAIPPLAEMQAMHWIQHLLASKVPVAMPPRSPHAIEPYELDFCLKRRDGRDLWKNKRGIEGESYTYQLALDMGAAPSFTWALKNCGWKALWTWGMGPNFNPKFLLIGPWEKRKTGMEILGGELWGVTSRSGGGVFFVTYTLIPLVLFATLSLGVGIWMGLKDAALRVSKVLNGAVMGVLKWARELKRTRGGNWKGRGKGKAKAKVGV